jgi:Zn-dependent protease
MHELNTIQMIVIWALPVLFAVTVHEASHGYVANYYGDRTAKMLGRLTLSPHKHIDPIGTLAVPGFLILLGAPFIFGWAKPVPVNSKNLKNPRRDMAIIALAGPISNLIMALMWAMFSKLALILNIASLSWINEPLFLMGIAGIQINLMLMLLNLLPLPPLDGSKVMNNFLRGNAAIMYDRIEPYGFLILILLLATGILSLILKPLFIGSITLIIKSFGLS